MDIRIKIQRNQIHHFIDNGEFLQFGMSLPDYPDLSTYGMRVDYPHTQTKVLDAMKAKLVIIRDQIARDNLIRQQI
jgi:hypothetical protein